MSLITIKIESFDPNGKSRMDVFELSHDGEPTWNGTATNDPSNLKTLASQPTFHALCMVLDAIPFEELDGLTVVRSGSRSMTVRGRQYGGMTFDLPF